MSDDRSDAMARFTPNGQHQYREGRLQDRRQDTRGVEGVRIGEGARRGDRVEGLTGLRITELNVTVSDVVATIDGQGGSVEKEAAARRGQIGLRDTAAGAADVVVKDLPPTLRAKHQPIEE